MFAQTFERPAVQGAQWPQAISGARPTWVPGAGASIPGRRSAPSFHARGDLVAEDHAGGDAVRLLSSDDA
jgi:hypothetical protein